MIKYLLTIFLLAALFSCSCKKRISNSSNDDKNTIENTNSIDKSAVYNSTKEYAIVIKKTSLSKNNPFPTISFSIIDLNNSNRSIFNDTVPGGRVKWISDYAIEVKSMIGRPKDIHSKVKKPLYKLNVKSLTKFK